MLFETAGNSFNKFNTILVKQTQNNCNDGSIMINIHIIIHYVLRLKELVVGVEIINGQVTVLVFIMV